MQDNPVRAKLLKGGSSFGQMAFEFFTPGLSQIMAAAGAEFVILDTEHSGAGIDTIKSQVAYARGTGIYQEVTYGDYPGYAVTANASVTNLGSISAVADANAVSTSSDAYATAYAYGVWQDNHAIEDSSVTLDNHGDISARAIASADGDVYDYAEAVAFGHEVLDFIGEPGWDRTNDPLIQR